MKKTIETVKNFMSELETTCKDYAKKERDANYNTFRDDTLKDLSKGFDLSSKASNYLCSGYAVRIEVVNALRLESMEKFKECEEEEKEVISKVIKHVNARVSEELKATDNAIYSMYEPLKLNNFEEFDNAFYTLINVHVSKKVFTFLRAYMFTTEKALSKKAFVKKFIDLLTSLKVSQGNYSYKVETITFKNTFKDIKITDFDKTNFIYEDLKVLVSMTSLKGKLVNNDMVQDSKLIKKALKEVLVLNEEETEIYYRLFK